MVSCCCSVKRIDERPEFYSFCGERGIGWPITMVLVLMVDEDDLDRKFLNRLSTSTFWFSRASFSSSIFLLFSIMSCSISLISLFNLSTDLREMFSIADNLSLTLNSGIAVPNFSFSTNLMTLKNICFMSWENCWPLGIFRAYVDSANQYSAVKSCHSTIL